MTTLADMTPEERARYRGMWCDFPDPDERTNLAIYVDDSLKHQGFCELIHEGQLGRLTIPENLTPRFDLPRAWMPDGQPPAGKWEYLPEYLEVWGEWRTITAPTTNKAEAESWVRTEQFKNVTTRIKKRRVGEWQES